MTDLEKRTIYALACMVSQYLQEHSDDLVDSDAMNAGESAIDVLADHGYMEFVSRGRIFGRWTEAGKSLLVWGSPFTDGRAFPMPQGVQFENETPLRESQP